MDIRRRMMLAGGGFPAEPTDYELIGTYTASGTFTAPEDGWFQVEVFGASGNGGKGAYKRSGKSPNYTYTVGGGGGGGGGGYSCSRVKLREGDKITLTLGAIGGIASSAVINSSIETYNDLQVTSGANGGAGTATISGSTGGAGGAGGTASGGNYINNNGGSGGNGNTGTFYPSAPEYDVGNGNGGAGGAAGYTGGRTGGKGATATASSAGTAGNGLIGFIKIYRGNTN